jgi:hypothetical protein
VPERAREVVGDFASIFTQAKAPGVMEGGVGEGPEGRDGDLGVGEVGVDCLVELLASESCVCRAFFLRSARGMLKRH